MYLIRAVFNSITCTFEVQNALKGASKMFVTEILSCVQIVFETLSRIQLFNGVNNSECTKQHTNKQLFTSQDVNGWTGEVCIIVMFLSVVWTLVLFRDEPKWNETLGLKAEYWTCFFQKCSPHVGLFCLFFHYCINEIAKIIFYSFVLLYKKKLTLNIFIHPIRHYTNKAQFNSKLIS